MAEALTEIHLVRSLSQAFVVARELGALGIGLDVEGVLRPYIGNEPTVADIPKYEHHNEGVARRHIIGHREIAHGLMTNNTNKRFPGYDYGLVDTVACTIGKYIGPLPFVYKNMVMADGTRVLGKPAGHQGRLLAEMLELDSTDMVLIDDQGVKNTGEAVKAGFKAIVVPDPIGFTNEKGRIIEHKGVMRFRKFEPLVYRSLRTRGNIAMAAYKIASGIDLTQIAHFEDHRQSG